MKKKIMPMPNAGGMRLFVLLGVYLYQPAGHVPSLNFSSRDIFHNEIHVDSDFNLVLDFWNQILILISISTSQKK